jgi:hypothetical protein
MIEYESGAKRSDLKPMYRKLPYGPIQRVALALSKGSLHYDDNPLWESNWQKGDEQFAAECWDHLLEHIFKALDGFVDGEDHYAHAVCNLLFLMWFQDKGVYDISAPPVTEEEESETETEPSLVDKFKAALEMVGIKK